MKTDVDTCLREIADWYARNRRGMAEPELEAILLKHCESEAEKVKFVKFLEIEPGQLRFKTLLRERAVNGGNPQYGYKEKQPFIRVGERVRYIGSSRRRFETWPEGAWLEYGVTGTVKEYHPEHPAVRVGGEYFEALPPYAVVRWDFGGETAIDPDDEGKRWERINEGSSNPGNVEQEGKAIAEQLGVKYEGPQYWPDGSFAHHIFTDPVTGTTFGTSTLGEAKASLIEKRKAFGVEQSGNPKKLADEMYKEAVGEDYVKVYRGVTGREGECFLVSRDRTVAETHGEVTEYWVRRSDLISGAEEKAFYAPEMVPAERVGEIEALVCRDKLLTKYPVKGGQKYLTFKLRKR